MKQTGNKITEGSDRALQLRQMAATTGIYLAIAALRLSAFVLSLISTLYQGLLTLCHKVYMASDKKIFWWILFLGISLLLAVECVKCYLYASSIACMIP